MKYHIELDMDLKRNPYKGLYIALEGIDGSGKTSQIPFLKEYFEKQGKEVITTREPRKGQGIVADITQQLLLGEIEAPKEVFQYLHTVDRVLHHKELIIPALKEGKIVITDRCFWSAVPYGIWDNGEKYNYDKAKEILIAQGILAMQLQFTAPDITFYFDITPELAIKRLSQKKDAKELYEKEEILEKIVGGYQWLLKEFPKEFTIIDAKGSLAEVTNSMVQILQKFPKKI